MPSCSPPTAPSTRVFNAAGTTGDRLCCGQACGVSLQPCYRMIFSDSLRFGSCAMPDDTTHQTHTLIVTRHATQFGWGIHYYPYHSLSPGRRLSRDFVKTRGRVLQVQSCNKGVICMPVWGYATSAIGWLALAWLSGDCRALQGKPSGEQKVCLEILGTVSP
ncbi:hypothetical protein B296_00036671 [Ensete ventricosum]|uniref:Uncharacterized protein n=1 Tax=Ensete ventricosum TaxID=4639 RepID=A0A427A1V8_ENSVE|nr:hypothetical protein B296_00036671 [Ensete ventricosum]